MTGERLRRDSEFADKVGLVEAEIVISDRLHLVSGTCQLGAGALDLTSPDHQSSTQGT